VRQALIRGQELKIRALGPCQTDSGCGDVGMGVPARERRCDRFGFLNKSSAALAAPVFRFVGLG
jgi:hypothetical protein